MSVWRLGLLLVGSLAGAATYSGRVLEDHGGSPLSRVEIRITRGDSAGSVAETESDAQGRFRTPDLPPGDYRFQFSRSNYSSLIVQARADLVVRLIHYGAIAGRVLDANGHPVPVALLAVLSESGQTSGEARDGAYRIFGLLPGRYRLAILSLGREGRTGALFYPNNSQPREFVIAGGEEYNAADFIVPDGGTYTISGYAAGTARLVDLVSAEHPELRVSHTVAKQDGSFRFDHVAPGNYVVLTADIVAGQFGRAGVTVGSQDVDVSVPANQNRSATFTLRGDAACGTTATVSFVPVDGWMASRKPTLPVSAGKPATLTGLGPGRYAVSAKSGAVRCYAAVPNLLDLTEEASRTLEVVLAPPGSIRGHLAGSLHPHEIVAVLIPSDGSALRLAYPDDDGRFGFDGLAPGRYYVNPTPLATGRWMPADGRLPQATEVPPGATVSLEIQ